MNVVVTQSFRTYAVPEWISLCMQSVKEWANTTGYRYLFVGDEFFDLSPEWYRKKVGRLTTITTDLSRLILARNQLIEGADLVIWVDADLVIYARDQFKISLLEPYTYCREVVTSCDSHGRMSFVTRVNNAVCSFNREAIPHLDDYIYACARNVWDASELYDNAEVGTKLLSVAHHRLHFSLIQNVGLFHPTVLQAILDEDLEFLKFIRVSQGSPIFAANLCNSLSGQDSRGFPKSNYYRAVRKLLQTKGGLLALGV